MQIMLYQVLQDKMRFGIKENYNFKVQIKKEKKNILNSGSQI